MRFVSLLFALAPQLHAAPLCTVARTYLAPAHHNPCFERLMPKAKTQSDRKWLLETARTWSPPKDLVVTALPGGFALKRGARAVGSVQWVSVDPPVIYLNGQFKYGTPTPDGSRASLVHQMFAAPKTAFLFSPLPEAFAEDADAALMEKMTTLFTLYEMPSTAEEYIAGGHHYAVTFPQVGVLKAWTTGQAVTCTARGVENLTLPFGTDGLMNQTGKSANFTLTAIGKSEFVADGVVPGKKVIVKVETSERGLPCIDTGSQEQDKKYCYPAWNKFFAQNPKLRQQFEGSGNGTPECRTFDKVGREQCNRFWYEWSKQFRSYTDSSRTVVSVCQDDACKVRQPMDLKDLAERTTSAAERELKTKQFTEKRQNEIDAYVAFLKANDINGADTACLELKCREPVAVGNLSLEKIAEARRLLPRLVNETDDGLVVHRILQRAAMGAVVLSACCAQKSCREVAYKKLALDLKPPAAASETSK